MSARLRNSVFFRSIGMLLLFASMSFAVDLFFEDFEGVQLQPTVTFESELRDRQAWQMVGPNGPTGWTEINDTTTDSNGDGRADPVDTDSGVMEFAGWRFVDKEWWIRTAGDQGRTGYLNGQGIVAVADPDEWDDFGNPDGSSETTLDFDDGTFDSTLVTPSISLASRPEGEIVKLSFNSSWREEDLQTATLTAVYDAGAPEELLFWTSSLGEAPNLSFHDDAVDESLSFDLSVPDEASNVQFEFRLQGNNDWWWALDNIRVFTGENPGEDGVLRAIIDRETGNVRILNNTGSDLDLRGYSLRSDAGVFDESAATFLANEENNWLTATQVGGPINDLSEVHLESDVLNAGDEINLGNVWQGYFEELRDLSFSYLVEDNPEQIVGVIQLVGNEGLPFQPLDLNFDGDIDILDWETFKVGYGTDLSGLTLARRYAQSDLDGDGFHTLTDFTEFERLFEIANGSGSFEAMLASVPEPGTCLLLLAGLGGLSMVRQRRRVGIAITCLVLLMPAAGFVDNANAQLVLLQEDFEDLELGPHIEEGGGGGGDVWTNIPPEGWTTDNSGVPGIFNPPVDNCPEPETCDGVFDWANWAFVTKDAWIEADDQGRSAFDFGTNVVMVADPDEWDDADGANRDAIAQQGRNDDLYDVFCHHSGNKHPLMAFLLVEFAFRSTLPGSVTNTRTTCVARTTNGPRFACCTTTVLQFRSLSEIQTRNPTSTCRTNATNDLRTWIFSSTANRLRFRLNLV